MATTHYTFYGCPAYLKQVLDRYVCEVWLSKTLATNYTKLLDPSLATERPAFTVIDLRSTPLFNNGTVVVDDYIASKEPGLTNLGGEWPNSSRDSDGHAAEAGVYLIDTFWDNEVKAGRLQWPPADAAPNFKAHQLQSRLYVDLINNQRTTRRYFGFHARLKIKSGSIAAFEVFPLGAITPQQIWVDLSSRDQCDVTNFNNPGDEGELFLRWSFAQDAGLKGPKLPIGLGEGAGFPFVKG